MRTELRLMAMVGALALVALMFTGCTAPRPGGDVHGHVVKADQDWQEYKARQVPKAWVAGRVELERRVYEKAYARRGQIAEWRIREAGWNYVKAVNEARIPDVPSAPGKFSAANHPFMEGATLK